MLSLLQASVLQAASNQLILQFLRARTRASRRGGLEYKPVAYVRARERPVPSAFVWLNTSRAAVVTPDDKENTSAPFSAEVSAAPFSAQPSGASDGGECKQS